MATTEPQRIAFPFAQMKRMARLTALASWLHGKGAVIDKYWLDANSWGNTRTPEETESLMGRRSSTSETKTGEGTTTVTQIITLFGGVDLAYHLLPAANDPEALRIRLLVQRRERWDGEPLPQNQNVIAITAPMIGFEFSKPAQ
ncbi:MAG: hypothetical protein JXA73_23795 [Acidobacteria bacterium]|nr:hypothetical protein [Acidobacteriota bacterium]